MATATLLASGSAGFQASSLGASITTPSVSPGANCLLVFLIAEIHGGFAGPHNQMPGAVTVSGSGPTTWTSTYSANSGSAFVAQAAEQRAAIGGTDPGSFTVTWTRSATENIGSYCYALWRVTGYDTSTPYTGGGAQAGSAGNGAVTLTLNATPASGDITLALTGADSDTGGGATFAGTTGTWTSETDFSATNWSGNTAQRTGYSTNANVSWSDVQGGSGNYSSAQAAVIVKATAGGPTGTGTPVLARHAASGSGTTGTSGTGTPVLARHAGAGSGTTTSPSTTGTGTPTLARHAAAGSGTTTAPAVTGSGTPTLARHTAAGSGIAGNFPGLYPATVDGTNRRLLDQNGDPWFGIGDAAWSLVAQCTPTEIVTYFDGVAAQNINFVMLSAPEPYYTDNGSTQSSNPPSYRNAQGDDPFVGANFASALNDDYWSVVDDAFLYAGSLGITVFVCPQYSGYAGSTDGWQDIISTQVAADSSKFTDYGNALATRYAAFPNIVWLIGHDDNTVTADMVTASDLIVAALESGTSHLWAFGSGNNSSGDSDWSASTKTSDFNTTYTYSQDAGDETATDWSSKTTIYIEGYYEQEQGTEQGRRDQLWAPWMEGASATIFGNNPRWHFESGKELYSYSGTWEASLTSVGTNQTGYLADLVAAVPLWADTSPDTTGTFLTAGTGRARFDTSCGIVYATAASSVTLDTTELAGSGNVRVRRYDPTSGAFTTVATSEAQSASRVVSYPGANTRGGTDWVYVVELTTDTTGTGTPTLARHAGAGSGTTTGIVGTGTPATARHTASGSGTTTGVTGTGTPTLARHTASGTGTTTGLVGTGTPTLTRHAASGTGTTGGVTGTGTPTLARHAGSGTGSTGVDGTGTPTLVRHAANGTGTVFNSQVSGSGSPTLSRHAAAGAGSAAPPVTGSGTPLLERATLAGTGTTGTTGTGTPTLVRHVAVGNGTTTAPSSSGSGTPALTRHTASGTGSTDIVTVGAGAQTLQRHTVLGVGTTGVTGSGAPTLNRHSASGFTAPPEANTRSQWWPERVFRH